jgi:hypothetical protein
VVRLSEKPDYIFFRMEDNQLIHNKKIRIHLLVWSAMLLYLMISPRIYTHFILTSGKPVFYSQELPSATTKIEYWVDRLDPIQVEGQKLYHLWGWGFIAGEPDHASYERFIVLKSNTKTYFFLANRTERPDVQTYFGDLYNNVTNTGFSTEIAKEAITMGNYSIGILFNNQNSDASFYIETNKEIVKTPNQLKLILADNQ